MQNWLYCQGGSWDPLVLAGRCGSFEFCFSSDLALLALRFCRYVFHMFLDDFELDLKALDCLIMEWGLPNVHYFHYNGFKWLLIHLTFLLWSWKWSNIIWIVFPCDIEQLAWSFDGFSEFWPLVQLCKSCYDLNFWNLTFYLPTDSFEFWVTIQYLMFL